MSRAALLPSRDHVGGGGIIRAGLGGSGDCGGREVVGEDAEAARCCRTSRMVETGGGWDEESVVVLAERRLSTKTFPNGMLAKESNL